MSKHTAGPWSVGAPTGLVNQISIQPCIGVVYGAGDEIKANAALISAAPDMYEALECLTLVVGLTAFKYEGQRAPLQEAMDQARAALTKAGGQ